MTSLSLLLDGVSDALAERTALMAVSGHLN